MATYSQKERLMSVTTPAGEDAFLLTHFHGREQISGLFSYNLQMVTERDDIDPSALIGKAVTVKITLPDGSDRPFHGYVRRLVAGEFENRGLQSYTAEVVPWFWFSTRTSDCRIFQEKTVRDIIEEVLGPTGFDFQFKLTGTYRTWDYCVQYRETDFNFLSRLMEQEGIFYYFEHEEGNHRLVMADNASAYKDCVPAGPLEYSPGTRTLESIESWSHGFDFVSGKWAQQDFNFETPSTDLKTEMPTVLKLPDAKDYELYDYPGEYEKLSEGKTYTQLRMEAVETTHDIAVGGGTCRSLTPAGKFELSAHELPADDKKKFVLTGVEHSAVDTTFAGGTETGTHYQNSFQCVPEARVYRPERTTPKPVVQGMQTAIVVGPSSEEIYTDKFGRVKVQFHWDRYGKNDENSSCWVRASQNWAGKNWGGVFLPRIGQEVVVAFLEGDPDRPMIIGRVYNAEQMPPYDLPANRTQSGIKSRSSKGGGADNFNELRFEDKKGDEEVYFHAEKDFTRVVENDDSLEVGNNQTIEVMQNRTEAVKKGNDTIKIEKGKQFTEAMVSIEHKVGQNSIKIEQSGITIKGIKITIQAQTITVVKGSAMVQIEGGLVTIN